VVRAGRDGCVGGKISHRVDSATRPGQGQAEKGRRGWNATGGEELSAARPSAILAAEPDKPSSLGPKPAYKTGLGPSDQEKEK